MSLSCPWSYFCLSTFLVFLIFIERMIEVFDIRFIHIRVKPLNCVHTFINHNFLQVCIYYLWKWETESPIETYKNICIKQQITKELSRDIVRVFEIIYVIPYNIIQQLIKCYRTNIYYSSYNSNNLFSFKNFFHKNSQTIHLYCFESISEILV